MLPPTAMNATIFSTSASNDADKIGEKDAMNSNEPKMPVVRRADSHFRPAHHSSAAKGLISKTESLRNLHNGYPDRVGRELDRQAFPEFNQRARVSQSQRPMSFVVECNSDEFEDRRSDFDTRHDYGHSTDLQKLDQRRTRNFPLQKRSEDDPESRRFYDDNSYGTDYRNTRDDAGRRSASVRRCNGNIQSVDQEAQDHFENSRAGKDYYGSKDFMERGPETMDRKFNQPCREDYIIGQMKQTGQFLPDFSSEEEDSFILDQRHRRRLQSQGRYESGAVNQKVSETERVEQPRQSRYSYRMQRSTDGDSKPSLEIRNRYCHDDGSDLITIEIFPQRHNPLDFDRFPIDGFGLDSFGFGDFSNDRQGHHVFF